MASLLLLVVGIGLIIVIGAAIGSRSGSSATVEPPDLSAMPPEAADYLAMLDSKLGLPSEVRAEIRAELADHVADSIAAIEAEGMDEERATREALARLGRPEDLAAQLRRAHQTTRRLLVGAGGGIFEAGVGAFWGYFVGLAIGLILSIIAATALKPILDLASEHLPDVFVAANSGSGIWTAIFWVPAFIAGRRSVQALGRGSRRNPSEVGRWWALSGFALLSWLALFVVSANHTWLTVAVVSLIPVAFAVGVLYRPDRPLPLARLRVPVWLVLASIVVLPLAMFAGASSGTVGSTSSSWADHGQLGAALDKIAPPWSGDLGLEDRWGAVGGPVIEETWELQDPSVLSGFRDDRFELWRAVPVAGTPNGMQAWLPAPGYTAPFATQPVDTSSGTFTARFDVGHVRTTHWLLLLTAVGPDGVRYRVDWRSECPTSFWGTIWDWLTAGS